jgi:hypothetical protein
LDAWLGCTDAKKEMMMPAACCTDNGNFSLMGRSSLAIEFASENHMYNFDL